MRLAERKCTCTDHDWQAHVDAMQAIRQTFAAAGDPVPGECAREREV